MRPAQHQPDGLAGPSRVVEGDFLARHSIRAGKAVDGAVIARRCLRRPAAQFSPHGPGIPRP